MIDNALVQLITAQNVPQGFGLATICASYLPEGAARPALLITTEGGDRNRSLDGDDDSYVQTQVKFRVADTGRPGEASTITSALVNFLANYSGMSVDRNIFSIAPDEPEDDADPPPDGSDNWYGGKKFTALVEHGAA